MDSEGVERKRLRVYLTEDSCEYIDDYLFESSIVGENRNGCLDRIIREHKEMRATRFDLRYMSQAVAKETAKALSSELTRIRLGANKADKNTQILIELLQGFMLWSNAENLNTTDNYKPIFLTNAEKVVEKNISTLKQKKDYQNTNSN